MASRLTEAARALRRSDDEIVEWNRWPVMLNERERALIADLLEAVDAEHGPADDPTDPWCGVCDHHLWPPKPIEVGDDVAIVRAALALADTVLGPPNDSKEQ